MRWLGRTLLRATGAAFGGALGAGPDAVVGSELPPPGDWIPGWCDSENHLRLVYRTPDWEDFVSLAVTEIRQFGANSTQVTRRMRAMLEDLIPSVPPHRASLLREELDLLKSSIDSGFTVPQDRQRADLPDFQGLGGRRKSALNNNDRAEREATTKDCLDAPPVPCSPCPDSNLCRGLEAHGCSSDIKMRHWLCLEETQAWLGQPFRQFGGATSARAVGGYTRVRIHLSVQF